MEGQWPPKSMAYCQFRWRFLRHLQTQWEETSLCLLHYVHQLPIFWHLVPTSCTSHPIVTSLGLCNKTENMNTNKNGNKKYFFSLSGPDLNVYLLELRKNKCRPTECSFGHSSLLLLRCHYMSFLSKCWTKLSKVLFSIVLSKWRPSHLKCSQTEEHCPFILQECGLILMTAILILWCLQQEFTLTE